MAIHVELDFSHVMVGETDNVSLPITVQLKTIFDQMTNFDLDIYDDKMLFDLVFTNHTGKRIRAFKGDLEFWDVFGFNDK